MLPGRIRLGTLLGVMLVSLACGGGDGGGSTGPSGLTFPPLDDAVRAQFCVRGNTTVGQTKSGSISAQDCDAADLPPPGTADTYYEIWRVRVAQAATVTFTVDAPGFDSYIDVIQVDIVSGDVGLITFLGSDDDTIGDDPQISMDLIPDTDYAIAISGFNYSETGAYTVEID